MRSGYIGYDLSLPMTHLTLHIRFETLVQDAFLCFQKIPSGDEKPRGPDAALVVRGKLGDISKALETSGRVLGETPRHFTRTVDVFGRLVGLVRDSPFVFPSDEPGCDSNELGRRAEMCRRLSWQMQEIAASRRTAKC